MSAYRHYYDYYKSSINSTHYRWKFDQFASRQSNGCHKCCSRSCSGSDSTCANMHASKTFLGTTLLSIPNRTDEKFYLIPDPTKFSYYESCGYHYDITTGLYYDRNTNYYWNSVIQKYLYYDHQKLTYLVAPVSSCIQQKTETILKPETIKTKQEKRDKVKGAKTIAKDMQIWAKTLNEKNKTLSSCDSNDNDFNPSSFFFTSTFVNRSNVRLHSNPPNSVSSTPLVASYGESELSENENNENHFLDFVKLICNLCKRQLTSTEALSNHSKLSKLHETNLMNLRLNCKKEKGGSVVYRDRAKERREKYDDTDKPPLSIWKKNHLKSCELVDNIPVSASAGKPIGSENVGSRLLQKMSWAEGQGLGKSNQGRASIIQRTSTGGLGTKATNSSITGLSYKGHIKKIMCIRYKEISEKVDLR